MITNFCDTTYTKRCCSLLYIQCISSNQNSFYLNINSFQRQFVHNASAKWRPVVSDTRTHKRHISLYRDVSELSPGYEFLLFSTEETLIRGKKVTGFLINSSNYSWNVFSFDYVTHYTNITGLNVHIALEA